MAHIKLLIMGLPGAGKTTLASRLAPLLNAVWFDADFVRAALWPEIGFSSLNRETNSSRMGVLCDLVNKAGHNAIASFICPTIETRKLFGATHMIWIDRIKEGRFADTNQMFVPPRNANLRLVTGSVDDWVDISMREINETAFYLRVTA